MVCKKIQPRHLIYSCVGLFAFFCTLFFGSVPSYATSITCNTITLPTQSNDRYANLKDECGLSNSDFPNYPYIKIDYTLTSTIAGTQTYYSLGLSNNVGSTQYPLDSFGSTSTLVFWTPYVGNAGDVTSKTWTGTFYADFSYSMRFFRVERSSTGNPFTLTITPTISSEPFDDSDCPDCPDCPPIPENPYDEKLDNLTTAVYTCGATLLVIYFLFLLYRIVIKHGGNR